MAAALPMPAVPPTMMCVRLWVRGLVLTIRLSPQLTTVVTLAASPDKFESDKPVPTDISAHKRYASVAD
jgi:hypothetical protein